MSGPKGVKSMGSALKPLPSGLFTGSLLCDLRWVIYPCSASVSPTEKVNRAILRALNGRPGKSSRCESCCSFSVVWTYSAGHSQDEETSLGLWPGFQNLQVTLLLVAMWVKGNERTGTYPLQKLKVVKITTDSDCSHEIKRCLLLGRKVMANLVY